MFIGNQLRSPSGYGGWVPGLTYYFLSNDCQSNKVRLILFSGDKNPKPILVSMTSVDFEDAILCEQIVAVEGPSSLPFWLEAYEGLNFHELDYFRRSNKENYLEKVSKRYLLIEKLVDNCSEVLRAEDPDFVINQYARGLVPCQNESRIRLWFYTYILFGRNIWSLMPLLNKIGNWDRSEKSAKKRLGRPPLNLKAPPGYGVTPEMAEKIASGYLKCKQQGKNQVDTYNDAMEKEFGCEYIFTEEKKFRMIHPTGKPFPSFGQFNDWVKKIFTPEKVRKDSYGKERIRLKEGGSAGSFYANLTNLMERVEMDAYYCKDRPRGFEEGSSMLPLCVHRALCMTSGRIIGMGFSHDKEDLNGYLAALFCMAIDKSIYFKLFGMTDMDLHWPCQGLALDLIIDRGPASTGKLIEKHEWLTSRELAVAYSGRSKASVESSHPRNKKREGKPQYKQSTLSIVQMARREITQVLLDNSTSDASSRCTPEMIYNRVKPTPVGIWEFLDERYRTNAQPIQFDDAVRRFLPGIEVTAQEDFVYFKHRRYDSPEFRGTGIYNRVGRNKRVDLHGYMLCMCVRHIWVEVDGRLFQLDAQLNIRDDENQLYVSIADLEVEEQIKREIDSEFRQEKTAASGFYRSNFKQNTGQSFDTGSLRGGRPKKNEAYKLDANDYDRLMSSKELK